MSQKSSPPFASWLPRLTPENIATEQTPQRPSDSARPTKSTWTRDLEAQFGLVATTSAPEADKSSEEVIAELQERLAYYEHFDDLIRDNVARSAELFRAAYSARAEGAPIAIDNDFAAEAVAAEVENRVTAERQHMQYVLMSIMDEATYMQQRSDALIQRLAEALTELAHLMPEEDEPVSGA